MDVTSTSHNSIMPNPMADTITAANQTSSPLLRLPPELRNRIWRFTVTGYIIMIKQSDRYTQRLRYVDMTPKGLTFQLAVAFVPTGSSVAVGNMAFGTKRRPIDLTSREHACEINATDHEEGCECEMGRPSVSDLFNIGQTCRQIHAETAFLQYHFNTFYFDHKDSMKCFAAALTSEQKDAIATIALDPKGKFINMVASWGIACFERKPISIPFGCLKYIIVAPSGSYGDRTMMKGYECCISVGTVHKKGLYLVCFDVFSGWMSLEGAAKLEIRLGNEKFKGWE